MNDPREPSAPTRPLTPPLSAAGVTTAPNPPVPAPPETLPSELLETRKAPSVPIPKSTEKDGPLTGSLFEGKYRVGPLLGEGGMGQVYRATHEMMRKDVAIKLLRPDMSGHAEIVERFRREAESAARLSHRNIITVLDFGRTADGTFYLVMEFVEGPSLTRLLRDGPLDWRRACFLGLQVLDGLAEAHRAGVVHRDLKPDNIMVTRLPDGTESPKIVDFGIAKLIEDGGPQLTAQGLVFGTPSYLSPEQALGQPVTPRADLYAMGVILFQMLAGRVPFRAPTTMELLKLHVQEPPPPLRALSPDVPAALEALVLRALAKKPEDRPADAAGLATELARLIGLGDSRRMAALPPPPPEPGPPPPEAAQVAPPPTPTAAWAPPSAPPAPSAPAEAARAPRRRWILFASLGAVLALALVLVFTLSDKSDKSDKSIKSDKSDKSDRSDRSDRSDKSDKSDKSDRSDTSDKSDTSGTSELDALKKRHTPDSVAELEREPARDLAMILQAQLEAFPEDGGLHLRLGIAWARLQDFRKALASFDRALELESPLRREPALRSQLNNYLINGTHWNRTLVLRLLREHWKDAGADEVGFLTVAINHAKTDSDHRYELYQFARSRGLREGVDEAGFWTAQLQYATTCQARLEASRWFLANGTAAHVKALEAAAKARYFHLASGATQDAACYRPVLLEAVAAARSR